MPTPMMPQVPTSIRLRGLYMSTMLRVKSSALAPSLTSIASGWALTMSHDVQRAVEVHRRRILRQRLGHLGDVAALLLVDRVQPLGGRFRRRTKLFQQRGDTGADVAD